MLATCSAKNRPRRPQDAPKSRPRGVQEASWSQQPPKTRPDTLQAWIWELYGHHVGNLIAKNWTKLVIILEDFAVKPVSSTAFSKNACLKRRTLSDRLQRSPPKYKGPAVIAAGVGNPPAPASVQGCQGRVRTRRYKRQK